MNLKRRWSGIALVSLTMILVLSACGGGAAKDKTVNSSAPQINAPQAQSGAVAQETDRLANSANVPLQPAAPADTSAAGLPAPQRMIVKNGALTLLVKKTDEAFTQVAAVAAQYGGYVISSDASHSGDSNTASLTIAVEAARFDTAMGDLRKIALQVLHDTSSGEDVTSQYVDLESRLHNLEATRDRVLTFLDRAQDVNEALQVNQQLTQIEGDIEQIKGQMTYYEGRSAFSTITVSLQEKAPETKKKAKSWSPLHIFDAAMGAQKALVKILATLLIWSLVFLGPYLLIAGLAALAWRRWVQRKQTRPGAPPSSVNE